MYDIDVLMNENRFVYNYICVGNENKCYLYMCWYLTG